MIVSQHILGIKLTTGSYNDILEKIITLASKNTSSYVCFANSHMVVEANRNASFNQVLLNADIVCADGVPLVYANKILNSDNEIQRFSGMDSISQILAAAETKHLSVYFYGSTEEVLESIENKIKNKYPKLLIAGKYSPPFRTLSEQEKSEIATEINSTSPHLVFVSLGCPKQESWMYCMKGTINSTMLGVGNAFLTFADLEKRAPVWMRNIGLEWLFRFIQEPKRLWKRYLLTNTYFIYIFVKHFFLK